MYSKNKASTAKDKPVYVTKINKELCKRCGICVQFCPQGVFIRDEEGYPVVKEQEKCTGCLSCFYYCPDFAVEVKKHDEGKNKKDDGREK
ncbi:MAG TPA: 4Fe-4S ferredoxin [Desulfotomaculum sp.]|jgi:2-oxoglutarate ferredoxin oxidoreductase subunit delta|nr:4Fe-4S ferredoxin [Desulfotomaculum sp.]